jgi:hypothetical protein
MNRSQTVFRHIVGMEPSPNRRLLYTITGRDSWLDRSAGRCFDWSKRQVGIEPNDPLDGDDSDLDEYFAIKKTYGVPWRCCASDSIGAWLSDLNEVWALRRRFRSGPA